MNEHQILIAGVDDGVVRKLVAQLVALGADFHRAPRAGNLARAAVRFEFDVILIGYPVAEASLDTMLWEIRSPASLSRYAGVVLLAQDHQMDDARRYVGRGANRVLSLDDPTHNWRNTVFGLLDVSQRYRLEAPVVVEHGEVTASCRTENVSRSGMLLRCAAELPVGSTLSFVMSVPGEVEPIRGQAQVARATDLEREGLVGIGAAFESFERTGETRLRYVLSRQAQ
jgi:hypothetical protein